jgi:alkanesulfonate monooxygenase SsuD/methylene tetrahydromethanopterin reductase-like flavin-dependent oxidoreductase (luciferase family)
MKFSVFLQPMSPGPADDYRVLNDILGQCILADELGLDGIFAAEHSFTGETVYGEPIVFATAVAMKTKRIAIGFAVLQLAVHQPVRTALQLAVLDNLSNGRLRVGVARGSSFNEWEYSGYGLTSKDGPALFEEALDVMVKAWTADDLEYNGEHYKAFIPAMRPTPYQKPHPPIYRSALTPESIKKIGTKGDPIMFPRLPGETARELLGIYEDALRDGGHAEDRIRWLLHEASFSERVYVAPTDDEAWADIEAPSARLVEHIVENQRRYGGIAPAPTAVAARSDAADPALLAPDADPRARNLPPMMRRGLIAGSPKTVLGKLRKLGGYGVRHFLCTLNWGDMPNHLVERSMRLLATEVMPVLREEFPAPEVAAPVTV